MMTNKQFRKVRLAHRIPQCEVAHRAGVAASTVCRWEKGYVQVDEQSVNRIVRALDELVKLNAAVIAKQMATVTRDYVTEVVVS